MGGGRPCSTQECPTHGAGRKSAEGDLGGGERGESRRISAESRLRPSSLGQPRRISPNLAKSRRISPSLANLAKSRKISQSRAHLGGERGAAGRLFAQRRPPRLLAAGARVRARVGGGVMVGVRLGSGLGVGGVGGSLGGISAAYLASRRHVSAASRLHLGLLLDEDSLVVLVLRRRVEHPALRTGVRVRLRVRVLVRVGVGLGVRLRIGSVRPEERGYSPQLNPTRGCPGHSRKARARLEHPPSRWFSLDESRLSRAGRQVGELEASSVAKRLQLAGAPLRRSGGRRGGVARVRLVERGESVS